VLPIVLVILWLGTFMLDRTKFGRYIYAIGALVIAVIANGLGLLNLPAGMNYIVTGGVLVLAATVDAVSRVRAGGTVIRT
jgi:D-xylose transport system permease protein